MNEEMKRLIEVLNSAGYEVMAIEDMEQGANLYVSSGKFQLRVANPKCLSAPEMDFHSGGK